jgi:hypothetical protein
VSGRHRDDETWTPPPDHPSMIADLHAWFAGVRAAQPEPPLSPRERYAARRRLDERRRAEGHMDNPSPVRAAQADRQGTDWSPRDEPAAATHAQRDDAAATAGGVSRRGGIRPLAR